MRIQGDSNGYRLWLSASETYAWAHRVFSGWPCSTLAGKRIRIDVDRNGLCDLAINGRNRDCDGTELDAIVSDHLPAQFRHLWPVWGQK